MATQFTLPRQVKINVAGRPYAGAQAFFYQTGTETLQTVYQDPPLTTPHQQPIPADDDGYFPVIWLDPNANFDYRCVVLSATGILLEDISDIPRKPFTSSDLSTTIDSLKRTQAEIDNAIVPVNYAYSADPVDPRRYGAVGDGVANDTLAWSRTLTMGYATNGEVRIPNNFRMLIDPSSLTMTGAASKSLRIVGGSSIGTIIILKPGATSNSCLKFTSADPATVLTEAGLHIENLSIANGGTKTTGVHGLSLLGIANWRLKAVRISGFDRGLDIQSSLIGTITDDCQFIQNNTGCRITLTGTLNTTNLIRIDNSRFNLNTSWGIDYNGGSGLQMRGNGIEGNGTAANTSTGGMIIRGALSPDALVANTILDGNHFEGNLGHTLYVEAPTGGCISTLDIRGGQLLAPEGGRSITVLGGECLKISGLVSAGSGDTWNLTSTKAVLENVLANVLTDSGISYPTYFNVRTGATHYYAGRPDSSSMTLGGISSPVSGTVAIIQQGDVITLKIPSGGIFGTSDSAGCTLTTLPAKYRPAVTVLCPAVLRDNGVDTPQHLQIQTDGTITCFKAGSSSGFTTSGQKGVPQQELRYRL